MSATMEVAPLTMPAKGEKSETAPTIFDVTRSPLPSGSFHSTFFKRSSFPAMGWYISMKNVIIYVETVLPFLFASAIPNVLPSVCQDRMVKTPNAEEER